MNGRFLHDVKPVALSFYLPQQPDEQMVHFMWPFTTLMTYVKFQMIPLQLTNYLSPMIKPNF
jgi:hypothetical protein